MASLSDLINATETALSDVRGAEAKIVQDTASRDAAQKSLDTANAVLKSDSDDEAAKVAVAKKSISDLESALQAVSDGLPGTA